MNCLVLSGHASPSLEYIQAFLGERSTRVDTFEAIEPALASVRSAPPRLVILTYIDEEVIDFIQQVKSLESTRTITLAVLDNEPELPLDTILESPLDDMILPPLTPFRLEGRLKLNIRRAAMHEALYQTEQELILSESMTRTILDTTVDGIITINSRGKIESFNKAAERIFGYTSSEVIGQNINVLMPSPYHEEHDEYMRSYHETGHRKIVGIGREVKGKRKNGEIFPMDLAVSEMALQDGVHYTGIIRDISQRRELENQLLTISEQERRRIGEDLHDGLGQMLTGLGLITKNLIHKMEQKDSEELQEVKELLALLKEADQQARALTRTLVPVDISQGGLEGAIIRVKSNIETIFNIKVTVETVGTIPSVPPEQTTHFYKIILEAINNAAKHSGGNQIKVVILGSPEKILARIQDNGVGIDKANLKENPGMGLRIMKHRASLIGASLDVRPGAPSGTVLTCTLPVTSTVLL